MRAQSKITNVYPFYQQEAEPTPKRWHWNPDKVWEGAKNFVVGIWFGYMLAGVIEGRWLW